MRGILYEIKQQPEHIRKAFMWVLVVITFSVVGFVGFRNTEQRFVALLNPGQAQEERALAEKTKIQTPSPFATIFNDFIYDNIMMSGLLPDDYNVIKKSWEETALCVFYYGKMLFDEIPHFVRDDNISIFLVEKRAAKPPFSLPNHNNKCHSEPQDLQPTK